MEQIERQDSVDLYNFLCDKIGSEEAVKTRRFFYETHNALTKTKTHTPFFSGSRGEGLDMKGSDTDTIIILEDILIVEEANDDCKANTFVMEIFDDNPGFARLKLCSKFDYQDVWCVKNDADSYLSSKEMKKSLLYLNKTNVACVLNTLHGPCISTSDETYDCTAGLRCKSFIQKATPWKEEHVSGTWPSPQLQEKIIQSGVLFVPVGNKSSPTEDIEWRISFSVAEKLLVCSFTHTQLLVYALLKILLKEVIEQTMNFKDMLCSYFLKTVVFKISENSGIIWEPQNFIVCFRTCLVQLADYVKKDHLPHYFLPEVNMLQHRITLQTWGTFKSVFCKLSVEWPLALCLSSTMWQFVSWETSPIVNSKLIQLNEVRSLLLCGQAILKTKLTFKQLDTNCKEMHNNNNNPLILDCLVGTLYRNMSVLLSFEDVTQISNQQRYLHLRKQLPFVSKGVDSDAISGRNVLATCHYCMGEYSNALNIIDNVLTIVNKETNTYLYYKDDKFTTSHIENLNNDLSKIYIQNTIEPNDFFHDSFLIPDEMKPEVQCKGYVQKPPIVYTFFLRFLCMLKLRRTENCFRSLNELKESIESDKYVGNNVMKAECYTLLGIASYLTSELLMNETAEYHKTAYRLDGFKQEKYLKMIDKIRKQHESTN